MARPRSDLEAPIVCDTLDFVCFVERSNLYKDLTPVRNDLLKILARLVDQAVRACLSTQPQIAIDPPPVVDSIAGLRRMDPATIWEILSTAATYHLTLQQAISSNPSFAGVASGSRAASPTDHRSPLGRLKGIGPYWRHAYLAVYHAMARRRFSGTRQVSVAFDPSTYDGEESLVAIAYSPLRNVAAHLPLQVLRRGMLGHVD
ncbi:MAG: hypothetical protein EOO77_34550, partial [Oxalobacteraceae bacterium]